MLGSTAQKLFSIACSALIIGSAISMTAILGPQKAYAEEEGIMALDNTGNTWFTLTWAMGIRVLPPLKAVQKKNTTPLFLWPHGKTFDMCYVYAEGLHPTWGWVDYTVN